MYGKRKEEVRAGKTEEKARCRRNRRRMSGISRERATQGEREVDF